MWQWDPKLCWLSRSAVDQLSNCVLVYTYVEAGKAPQPVEV
jgi:hypothetical protein